MTYPIVRMYESEQQARDAVSKLREEGFRDDMIYLLTPGGGGEGAASDVLAHAIAAGKLMGRRAGFYADRARNGRSLVVVDAPFGQGQLASDVMDEVGPVDTDLRLPEEPPADRASPLSNFLGWQVLSREQKPSFSGFLGLPILSQGRTFLSRMFGELASPHFAATSMFGLLARDGRPMMSMSLSRNPAPLSSKAGMPLLSGKAAPLSSIFGLPTTSRNPAPLSSMFRLPLLTGYR